MKSIVFMCLITVVYTRQIILSAGIGKFTHDQLLTQYNAFRSYKQLNIITASSILLYYIDENGYLADYQTNDTWTG